MKEFLIRLVPDSLIPTMKKMYYLPSYIVNRLKGQSSMVPPRWMFSINDGDFEKIGQEFKRYFIELANLQTNNRVLDVGCGVGRMAIPLTNYLSSEGEYWGFDINKKGIEWCESRISPKFHNFHFLHSDVCNE